MTSRSYNTLLQWRDAVSQNTLLEVLSGSRARALHASQDMVDAGRAKKVSDYDYRGVFDWPDDHRYVMGHTPPDVVSMEGEDSEAYELMKYMSMLFKPSAEAQEMLWSPVNASTEAGQMLRRMRHKLTSKQLVQMLLAGAGFASVDVVDAYRKTGDSVELRTKGTGMLGRAVRYRLADPREARKALTDSVRRLLVAYYMLRPVGLDESVESDTEGQAVRLSPLGTWDVLLGKHNRECRAGNFNGTPLEWASEDDGLYYVQLPKTELELLREFRYGDDDTDWPFMLLYRNDVFTALHNNLTHTKLREKADPVWGALFLKWFVHQRNARLDYPHRSAAFYMGAEGEE